MSHSCMLLLLSTYFCSKKKGSCRNAISMEHSKWMECIESMHINYCCIYTKLWSKIRERLKIKKNNKFYSKPKALSSSQQSLSFSLTQGNLETFQYGDFIMLNNYWIICLKTIQKCIGSCYYQQFSFIFSFNRKQCLF